MADGAGQPVLRAGGGEPGLVSPLRPRARRAGGRLPHHQPAEPPDAARRPGRGLREARLRPQAPDPDGDDLPDVPALAPADADERGRTRSTSRSTRCAGSGRSSCSTRSPTRPVCRSSSRRLPAGTPAAALPDGEYKHPFLEAFGRPARAMACECERDADTTLGQALHLVGGFTFDRQLRHPDGRVARLLKAGKSDVEVVEELFLATFSRPPTDAERTRMLAHFTARGTRSAAGGRGGLAARAHQQQRVPVPALTGVRVARWPSQTRCARPPAPGGQFGQVVAQESLEHLEPLPLADPSAEHPVPHPDRQPVLQLEYLPHRPRPAGDHRGAVPAGRLVLPQAGLGYAAAAEAVGRRDRVLQRLARPLAEVRRWSGGRRRPTASLDPGPRAKSAGGR